MADQASPATQQPPIVETWRVALAVAMFMTASASMLLINKLCMTAFPLESAARPRECRSVRPYVEYCRFSCCFPVASEKETFLWLHDGTEAGVGSHKL